MGTAVGHGSVDPKVHKRYNLVRVVQPLGPKGMRVNIPAPGHSSEGDTASFRAFYVRDWRSLFAVEDGNVFTLSETLAMGPERVFSSC
jgi:hypothetical protein